MLYNVPKFLAHFEPLFQLADQLVLNFIFIFQFDDTVFNFEDNWRPRKDAHVLRQLKPFNFPDLALNFEKSLFLYIEDCHCLAIVLGTQSLQLLTRLNVNELKLFTKDSFEMGKQFVLVQDCLSTNNQVPFHAEI